LRQIERQLQQERFKALVLDLRSAGGDDVQFAALLTDGLLDGGLMWTVQDAHGRAESLSGRSRLSVSGLANRRASEQLRRARGRLDGRSACKIEAGL